MIGSLKIEKTGICYMLINFDGNQMKKSEHKIDKYCKDTQTFDKYNIQCYVLVFEVCKIGKSPEDRMVVYRNWVSEDGKRHCCLLHVEFLSCNI